MADGSRSTGYLETAFRERQQVAEQQQTEIAKEASLLGRALKDRGRKDFAQQRKMQHTQVQHVARIGAGTPTKTTRYSPFTRGSAHSQGQVNRMDFGGVKAHRSQQKATGRATQRAAAQRSPTTRSAGGVATLSSGVKWTAAGGQAAGPQEDVSRFQLAHHVIDPLNPNRVLGSKADANYLRQRSMGTAIGASAITQGASLATAGSTSRGGKAGRRMALVARGGNLALKAKQQQQAQRVKQAKIEEYRQRIAPQYGPAAADAVMYEWSRRQEAMYGEGGTGGLLTPGVLFGNMERPK